MQGKGSRSRPLGSRTRPLGSRIRPLRGLARLLRGRAWRWRGHEYGGIPRDHWQRYTATLDPEVDYVEIQRTVAQYEFPWDMLQALSFALFRTYAVPSIGRLLARTGEFTQHTQKRYDDTALLLELPGVLGFEHPRARAAIRRINRMHGAYDIPDHEMRYVLSTFVVVPKRWLDCYGKRPLSPVELRASVNFYRQLGRHMGIPDIPEKYADFEELMDTYESERFGYDHGGRRVADATLALLVSFYPRPLAAAVEVFSRGIMDRPLLTAFGYREPPRVVVAASRAGLAARGRLLRVFPARRTPVDLAQQRRIRSYPNGYVIEQLGTFPAGAAGR